MPRWTYDLNSVLTNLCSALVIWNNILLMPVVLCGGSNVFKLSFFYQALLIANAESCCLASACKKMGGWWRWALVSPDGVAPSRMVGVSASVNLPLHHQVQKFSSGTSSLGWSRKKGRKTVVWCGVVCHIWLSDYAAVVNHSWD